MRRAEARVLAGVYHLGEPVERSVRIRAAHGLYEGRYRVVVAVLVLIVDDGLLLYRLLGNLHRETNLFIPAGRCSQDADLECREGAPRVPFGDPGKVFQRFFVHLDGYFAETAFFVGKRGLQYLYYVAIVKGFKLEDLRAREKRRVDIEKRVVRRGADEDGVARFDVRHQDVLLGLVETVYLVYQ